MLPLQRRTEHRDADVGILTASYQSRSLVIERIGGEEKKGMQRSHGFRVASRRLVGPIGLFCTKAQKCYRCQTTDPERFKGL